VSLLKLIYCNPFVSLWKNSLIVDWRDQSLPHSRSSWTEGKQSLMCLFLLSLYLLLVICAFHFDS